MAEKKSRKRKKGEEENNPTKDETDVAKYLRFNLKTKKASLFGDQAFYFSGSSAVNFLLDSKWAEGKGKSSVEFTHRESVVDYLQRILNCGLISRVHVTKTEKKVKKKDSDKKNDEKEKTEEKKADEKKETKSSKDSKTPGSPKPKKDGKEVKKVKKKVKVSLEIHEYQEYFDADDEYYVWIFDPISWKTFILGILLVLGVVVVCLFPLWPESVREYSWYLSVAGAVFVGSIIVLAILRYIIYGILWMATMGKLHFWLLPNLTAECGFFESFVPAYEYSFYSKEDKNSSKDERCDSGPPSDGDSAPTQHVASAKGEDSEESGSLSGKENGDWVKVKKDDADGINGKEDGD